MSITKRVKSNTAKAKAAAAASPSPLFGEVAHTGVLGKYKSIGSFNPSKLASRKGLAIFDEMLMDDQVRACMTFKKHAVLASSWAIKSPSSQNDDWEVTKFVEYVLNNLTESFEQSALGILTSLDYGFSISEKIWEEKETPFGKRPVITNIKTRSPYDFIFDTDDFGNLKSLKQRESPGSFDGKGLDPSKFVIFTYQKKFGNWYGTSDLEPAYRAWWVKYNAYQWASMYLERAGIPPIFAMYDPQSYNASQRDALKQIITRLQSSTGGILARPSRSDTKGSDILEFWTPELAGQLASVFKPMIEMYNTDIARALLMPSLIGYTPDSGQGSYARSKQNFDGFMLTIGYIARTLAYECISNQVIRQLVDVNYTGIEDYPYFEFDLESNEANAQLLIAWRNLVEKGIVTPQLDDERHIRGLIDFPELSEDAEPDYSRAAAPQEQKTFPFAEKHTHTRVPASEYKGAPWVNYAEIKGERGVIAGHAKAALVPVFESMRDALIGDVSRHFDSLDSYLGGIKLRGVKDMRAGFEAMLLAAYDAGAKRMAGELRSFAQTGTRTHANVIPDSHKKAIKWLRQWNEFSISGVLDDDLTKKTQRIIANGIKNGAGNAELSDKLYNLFLPYTGDTKVLRDGEPLEPYQLDTIVDTNMTTAMNQGRLIEARGNADIIQGMRYDAIIDDVTTEICQYLNGRIFEIDDPELDRFAPPNHYNCRSLLIAVPITSKTDEDEWMDKRGVGTASGLVQPGFGGER